MRNSSRQQLTHLAAMGRRLSPSKLLLCTLLTAVSALAQDPAASDPKTTAPTPAAQTPGTPTPTAPAEGGQVGLNFRDAALADVLAHYEKLAGVTLIIPNLVRESGMKITVATKATSPKEQRKILDMVLNINGIFILPTEDPKICKVTGLAIRPKSGSVPFVDDEKLLPKDEQLVMFLLNLKFQDATEVAQIISAGKIVPSSGNVVALIPIPNSNSLLITNGTAETRKLVRILRVADDRPVEVLSKFFTLTYAQADEVVTKLEARLAAPFRLPQPPPEIILDGPPSDLSSRPVPADEEANLIANLRGDNRVSKVKLTADKRTNRVHVVTRMYSMKVIGMLIKEYDADPKSAPAPAAPSIPAQ